MGLTFACVQVYSKDITTKGNTMTITYNDWSYTQLAAMAKEQHLAYKGDDSIYRAELLQRWIGLTLKAIEEQK